MNERAAGVSPIITGMSAPTVTASPYSGLIVGNPKTS